jgi:hypothetical protein
MRKLLVLPALLLGLLTLPVATAEALSFDCITGNDPSNTSCNILEDQISVDIADGGGGTVDFTFSNSGPLASSITDIYFDDDEAFIDSLAVTGSTGIVAFSVGCTPPDLPGGETVGFETAACADADPPPGGGSGVDPFESVTLTATLLVGRTFAELLQAIEDDLFNIGVHVQAFEGDFSEGGVLDDNVVDDDDDGGGDDLVVAEPTTLLLLGSGLVAVGARFRRRRENA